MRVRGKISLLLEGLSPISAVLKKALQAVVGQSFQHDASPCRMLRTLRSNGFGLTCAKFEGRRGHYLAKINKGAPLLRQKSILVMRR